ncbi:MAG: DnaD domain protein [Defluviitaleaceae bacterium]|nr:DnaD domain protein [Defluviitaleaceae bacterium]
MDFIREILAFERWLYTNHLPPISQLIWYKLFMLCNGAGWPEWVVVENAALMAQIHLSNKASFIGYRDKLLECELIEYQKGRKGSPNRYKMCSLIGEENRYELKPQMIPKTALQAIPESIPDANRYELEPQAIPETVLQTVPKPIPQIIPKPALLYKDKYKENKNLFIVVDDNSTDRYELEPQIIPETVPQNSQNSVTSVIDQYGGVIQHVQAHYHKLMGNMLSPTAYMEIADFLNSGVESQLMCRAIDISIDANVRNWAYAKKVINTCISQDILTLVQYETHEANRKALKMRTNGGVNSYAGNGSHYQFDKSNNPYQNIRSGKL